MGNFLKQFFEGLSCDSVAPVLFAKPISDFKFSVPREARNMTSYLVSSKNRLIYVCSRIRDSFPMCVKGRSVMLSLFVHECSHAASFRVELLLEENGNIGSLYVSKRNGDGIIHFIFSAERSAHRWRPATATRIAKSLRRAAIGCSAKFGDLSRNAPEQVISGAVLNVERDAG